MIFFQNMFVFYLLQIMLGVSAALFFVSSRAILMGSKLKNPDKAFAFFYAVPTYGDAIAPAVGAILIYKLGFVGTFGISVVFQIATAVFCYFSLRKHAENLTENIGIRKAEHNYVEVLKKINTKGTLPLIFTSFLVLIVAGFTNTFFVLFLKSLGWSQNSILIFNSISSLVFLPVSWLIVKLIKKNSVDNVSYGSQISGIFSILFGVFSNFLNFYIVFVIMLGKNIG